MRRTSLLGFAVLAGLSSSLLFCGSESETPGPGEDSDASADAASASVDGASVVVDAASPPEASTDAGLAAPSADAEAGVDAGVDAGPDAADADAATVAPADIVTLSVADDTGCVLRGDGRVKCWGNGNWLGIGVVFPDNRGDGVNEMGANLPFVELGANRKAVALFAGSYSATHCALLDDGALKCWGVNNYGQCGLGDTATRGDGPNEMGDALGAVLLGTNRRAIQLSTTNAHTCALLDDARVKCWGNNGDGQLGYGDTATRGDGANEMGDALPFVDLGAGRAAKVVRVANARTCVITDQDKAKCWGAGSYGQLGNGSTGGRGSAANQMGAALPDIDLGAGRTVKQLALGIGHTCALLDDGKVKCWGDNPYGQLGLGDTADRGDGANEMGDLLPAVDLGPGRTAKQIAAGASHTCAILDDDTLKCWGENNQGQLGLGDTNRRGDGANEMGANLPVVNLGAGRKAKALAPGASHTCALLDDGKVKCWGYNAYGQLGLGDTNRRGDGANEMGDQLPALDL